MGSVLVFARGHFLSFIPQQRLPCEPQKQRMEKEPIFSLRFVTKVGNLLPVLIPGFGFWRGHPPIIIPPPPPPPHTHTHTRARTHSYTTITLDATTLLIDILFLSPLRSYSTLSVGSSRSSLASDLHDVGIPSPLPNNLSDINPLTQTPVASTQDIPSATTSSPLPPLATESNEPQEVDPTHSSLPVPEIKVQSEEMTRENNGSTVGPESTETITNTDSNQVSDYDIISSDNVNLPVSVVDDTTGGVVEGSGPDFTLVNENGLASSLKSDDTLTGSQEIDRPPSEEARDGGKPLLIEASNNSSANEPPLPLSEISDQLTHSNLVETLPHASLPGASVDSDIQLPGGSVDSDTQQLPVGTNAELGETTFVSTLPEPEQAEGQAIGEHIQALPGTDDPHKSNTNDHGVEISVSENIGRPRGESVSSRRDNVPSSKSEKKDRFSIFRSASKTGDKGKGSKRSGKKDKSKRSRGKREERFIDDNQSEASFQPDIDLSTKPKGSKKASSKYSLHIKAPLD